MQLLDISQPEAPQPLAHYPTSNQLVDLTWRDGRIYLAGWSGLEIVDVRDPNNLKQIGTYATDYPAQLFPSPPPHRLIKPDRFPKQLTMKAILLSNESSP